VENRAPRPARDTSSRLPVLAPIGGTCPMSPRPTPGAGLRHGPPIGILLYMYNPPYPPWTPAVATRAEAKMSARTTWSSCQRCTAHAAPNRTAKPRVDFDGGGCVGLADLATLLPNYGYGA
jgi:hypothetical protein